MKRGKAAAGGDMFIVDNRVASFKTRKWPHAKAMIPKVRSVATYAWRMLIGAAR